MPLSAQAFVARWRHVDLKERSASQSHFNDLCALVGQPTPVEDDPTGARYTFEAGASKQSGGEGWADVWKRGYFAWEYKGKHANLDAAYAQLLLYRESLENPPLLVVCDLDRIVVHTNFTNTVKRVETFTWDDLLDPTRLGLLRAVWSDPERFRPGQTPAGVTQEAAARFSQLAELLRRYGAEPQAVAHFLIRLLFCLFAEDVGILPRGLFSKLVATFRRQPRVFAAQLADLFQKMALGGAFGFDLIPHVDGGLFDAAPVLELDSGGLDILAEVCALDWANIEPSILGTLFERGLDPAKRAQLGAHYTSREDILLIVEPVLMAPLRRRWGAVRAEAEALAAQRDAARGQHRTRLHAKLEALLTGYVRELADVQVLDPACGSGNFLYVALKQMLDLWKEISALGFRLGLPARTPLEGDAPHPAQLHGIEINPYAHELAQTTIWIGHLQWLRDNGFGLPAEPILKPLQAVAQMDALLAYDADGRPIEPAWPQADVIIGNPPFLGDKMMRRELGDRYVDDLRALYEGRIPGQSDLCCYWFERARALIAEGQVKRAGLLATQGIRGGANRTVLQRIKASGDIFIAWADRDWVLDGAAVHVSMVGFDDGSEAERALNGQPVQAINANLTSAVDLTTAARLTENFGLAFQGPVKVGPFDIADSLARKMLALPNPHGKPNEDVLRPWANGSDITGHPRGRWIIDFGERSLDDACLYEAPFEYVKQSVFPVRAQNRDQHRREYWWRLGRSGSDFKDAMLGLTRMILVPRVAKHLVFVWAPSYLLPDSAVVAFARDDDYFFGVLHARPHALWARRMGTQLREAESGSRYTPTTCFETYPCPWPPGQEPPEDARMLAIAAAAQALVEQREHWLHPAALTRPADGPALSQNWERARLRPLQSGGEGAAPAGDPPADGPALSHGDPPAGGAADCARTCGRVNRTLTGLYNANPTWLQLAHRRLDVAVFAAYGWPADLADDELLRRLLALNLARA